MTELLKELVDKWMIVCAFIAVGFTESLMRWTSEKVTKWKYAILSTIGIALLLSLLISLNEVEVSWQDGLIRGAISAILAIAGYDTFKSAIAHIPFLNKE